MKTKFNKILNYYLIPVLLVILFLAITAAIAGKPLVTHFTNADNIKYDWYIYTRWFTFVPLILLSIALYIDNKKYWPIMIFSLMIAIIFNPINIFNLTREIWLTIDIIVYVLIIIILFRGIIMKSTNLYNPKKLVTLLSNFTIDKPIKYTTHDWEVFNPVNCDYKNFDGYMDAVKKQFEIMKKDLEKLSPNLYKKIYTFLLEETPDNNYSWCHKTHINIGWSSLKGLREHCNAGNNAETFLLPNPILYNGKDLTVFKDIVDLFKQEIEIRIDFENLRSIFIYEENRLVSGRDSIFTLDLSAAQLARQFYTDAQKLSGTISKIFNQIKIRKEYPNIIVTTQELEEDRSIVLKITQIGSSAHCNAKDLLEEVKNGDFADIKESLTNLCDWSVESSFEEKYFRVNYMCSNNVKDIETLSKKPEGFTHILRFYK